MTKEVTVAQLIAHLQSLPPEAIVRVGKQKSGHYETWMDYEDVEIEFQDVHDYRGEKWKDSSLFGKIIVDLEAQ